MVKSVSKLYLQVGLICQNRHLVSYRQVPGSIPGRGSIDYFSFLLHFSLFFDSVPLLFHSNFQIWQMSSLPTLDPYVFFWQTIVVELIFQTTLVPFGGGEIKTQTHRLFPNLIHIESTKLPSYSLCSLGFITTPHLGIS